MQKTKALAATVLLGVMIIGCGAKEAALEITPPDEDRNVQETVADAVSEQTNSADNEAEEAEEPKVPEEPEEVEKPNETEVSIEENNDGNVEEELTEEAKGSDVVDIKDYLDVWTVDFGGDLEQQLADKLGSKVETSEMGDSYVICDGALEFYGAANNTGYFVWEYKPVENFYIYGISVGMDVDEAVKILKEQGLEEDSDYAAMYSTDFDQYRVEVEAGDGKVTKLTYVRSTGAKVAADFTETP